MTDQLVGITEICGMAGGRPRQTVWNWTHREDFPPPSVEMQAGRFWSRPEVVDWIAAHDFAVKQEPAWD